MKKPSVKKATPKVPSKAKPKAKSPKKKEVPKKAEAKSPKIPKVKIPKSSPGEYPSMSPKAASVAKENEKKSKDKDIIELDTGSAIIKIKVNNFSPAAKLYLKALMTPLAENLGMFPSKEAMGLAFDKFGDTNALANRIFWGIREFTLPKARSWILKFVADLITDYAKRSAIERDSSKILPYDIARVLYKYGELREVLGILKGGKAAKIIGDILNDFENPDTEVLRILKPRPKPPKPNPPKKPTVKKIMDREAERAVEQFEEFVKLMAISYGMKPEDIDVESLMKDDFMIQMFLSPNRDVYINDAKNAILIMKKKQREAEEDAELESLSFTEESEEDPDSRIYTKPIPGSPKKVIAQNPLTLGRTTRSQGPINPIRFDLGKGKKKGTIVEGSGMKRGLRFR